MRAQLLPRMSVYPPAFRLEAGHVVYDGRSRRMAAAPAAWQAGEEAAGRVRLEFVTPAADADGGTLQSAAEFRGSSGGAAAAAAFSGGAVRVRTEEARFELYRWDRYSGRQGRATLDDLFTELETRKNAKSGPKFNGSTPFWVVCESCGLPPAAAWDRSEPSTPRRVCWACHQQQT